MSRYGVITGAHLAMAGMAIVSQRAAERVAREREAVSKEQPQDHDELERLSQESVARAEKAKRAEMKDLLGYVPEEPLTRQQRRQLERAKAKSRRHSLCLRDEGRTG